MNAEGNKIGLVRITSFLFLLLLWSCQDAKLSGKEKPSAVSAAEEILASLTDPAKLDTLKGKRAATPRLRKSCYWLEVARREGQDVTRLIESAQRVNGSFGTARASMLVESLARNRTILERLGCLDEAGMSKLRKGNAPTITKGPYAGELATGDHIIPRSVCPVLDNVIVNLEFLPATLNQSKGAKVGDRQVALARKFHAAGIIDATALSAIKGSQK